MKRRGTMGIGFLLFVLLVWWGLSHVGMVPRLF